MEPVRAVRWVPGKEEVCLAVVFDTFVLFLGDDWRIWGNLEIATSTSGPGNNRILSVDSGPVALDQSFFFIVNTCESSCIYRVSLLENMSTSVETARMLELPFTGEPLQFGDYLGLDAIRGQNEFYFYNGSVWETGLSTL